MRETPRLAMEIGETNLTVASGVTPALNFDWSSVPGPYWAELMRRVDSDNASPYDSAFQSRVTSTNGRLNVNIYGPSADGQTTYGTYANSIYCMPIVQARGDADKYPVTIVSGYPAQSDPGPFPVWPGMAQQNWPNVYSPISVVNGSNTITSAGLFNAKWIVGGQYQFSRDRNAPFYTLAGKASTSSATLDRPYEGATQLNEGAWGPFGLALTTAATAGGGDFHVLVISRNESTGFPGTLDELYQLRSDDGGATWVAAQTTTFDLMTGEQRPDPWTSACASGGPITPFLLRYDEILSGTIRHPLRASIPNQYVCTNTQVWPATHFVGGAGSPDYTAGYLPMGSRLRLKASWYNANVPSMSSENQVIATCLRDYGLFIDDIWGGGSDIWMDGPVDSRWRAQSIDDFRRKPIPLTAFELLDTVNPQFSITGPSFGAVGVAQTFGFTYLIDANTNFSRRLYFTYQRDGDSSHTTSAVDISQSVRSATWNWTPTLSGWYSIWFTDSITGMGWLAPTNHRFLAS